jgi:hypothetical protein
MLVHKTSNISAPCVPRNADSHATGLAHNHVEPSSATFPAREGSGCCIPEWLIIAPWPTFCNTSTFHLLTHVSGTNVLQVQSTYCRLYSMASICCSAPSACHPSTPHLQTAKTLRSAIVTTGQRRTKTQFPTGATHYSILRCTNRLWGSSNHLANGYRGFYTAGEKRHRRESMATHHHPVHQVSRSWKRGAMPPLLPYILTVWCFIKQTDLAT